MLARSSQQAVGGAPNTQECKQMTEMGSAVGLQMDAREKRGKSVTPKAALTDYQMQLMLLEQQGKKRCMTAKLESGAEYGREGCTQCRGERANEHSR